MKLAHGHLSYCTNIHAGESWAEHFEALKKHFPAIKHAVSPGQSMGIGLRLSNAASKDILQAGQLQIFKEWLLENDAYVFTMNGFPYGDFHHAIVKDKVHTPDWTTKERLDYSCRLFDILAELLPEGLEGGISTSPLSYKYWYKNDQAADKAMLEATNHIISVAEYLYRLKQTKGISLHLDIEPEPDGLLETGQEFIHWFEDHLLRVANDVLPERLQFSESEASDCIRDHIRLCYDVCHFAIGYEPMDEIIKELSDKGICVGKIQISAALKAEMPADSGLRMQAKEAFSKYIETTYLHQVVARRSDHSLIRYRDLPEALEDSSNSDVKEWRAHFHVPVFAEDLGALRSTRSDIVEILKKFRSDPFSDHLEVETYTWEVLPESLKLPIDQSIIRELNWVKNELK